jgi:signal transduction histidine kinase
MMYILQMIVNVLENAIKYSPDVPNIDVYTRKHQRYDSY